MEPISGHSGLAVSLPMSDMNTDLIYPQQFLGKPDREAMGQFLFHSLRFLPDGSPNPDFILNKEPYDTATILIAGNNFDNNGIIPVTVSEADPCRMPPRGRKSAGSAVYCRSRQA